MANALERLYFFLEEKYYRVMDFLNDKLNIPVYKYYVNPIESRGVPSFPVTVIILIAIIALLLFLLLGGAPGGEATRLTVIVKSKNLLLENANVVVLDEGTEIASKNTIAGKVFFIGLPLKTLLVKASKPNFSPASKTIDFSKQKTLTLELGCNTAACLEELSKIPGSTVTPQPSQPGFPTVPGDAWNTGEPDDTGNPGNAKAKLVVKLKNKLNASAVPDGTVRLYNADSEVLLDESATTNGKTVFKDLEAGMKVYLTVEAEGYLPYDGSQKKTTLKKTTNTVTVTLTPLINCQLDSNASECVNVTANYTNYATSTIRVVDAANETPISGAKVSVYNASSNAALYKGKTTNANGTFKANLSIGSEYYAVASKTNYFTEASTQFEAGENATIALTRITPETTANLTVNVFDVDGEPVTGASVAVFSLNASGQTVKLGEGNTGSVNYVVFKGLRRGINVRVNASKTTQIGFVEVNLTQTENNVSVNVSLLNATIIARAIDLFKNTLIEGVEFKAFKKGVLLASCTTGGADNACVLAVNAKKMLEVNASKIGFQPNPWSTTLSLQPEQVYELNASMAGEEDLSDVQAIPSDPFVVDAFSQEPVSKLKLGHSYTARLKLVSKATAGLQASGVHLRLEPFGNAFITGYAPLAPLEQAGIADETKSGCSDLKTPDFSSEDKYSWLDLTWGGAKNYDASINFTVSTDAKLDDETKSGVLAFKYRAFGKKSDGGFVRNPFDPRLGTQPDTPLESGCDAEADSKDIVILSPGTTCGKGFCVSLRFHQEGKEGNAGFQAVNDTPLLAFYNVEVFTPLKDFTRLLYAVGPQFLRVDNVSIPIPESGVECGPEKQNVFDSEWASGKPVQVDLSALKECSDYPPLKWPYAFSGTIYGWTLQASNNVPATLSFASANSLQEINESNELNHSTWFSISGGPARKPVEITLKLKQEGYNELKSTIETRQVYSEAFVKDDWASCAEDSYSYCASNASKPDFKPQAYSCTKYSRDPTTDSYVFQSLPGVLGAFAGFPAFAIQATGPDYEVPQDSKNKPIELTFSINASENVYGGVLRIEVPEKWPAWAVNPNDLYYYPKGCALENASIDYPEPMLDPLLGNDETQHPNRSKMWRCTANSPTGEPENAQELRSFVQNKEYNADDCRQFVKIIGAEFGGQTFQPDSGKSFVEIPVGDLQKDAVVTGKATLVPLVPEAEGKQSHGWRAGVIVVFNGSYSKNYFVPATAKKSEYIGRYCDTIPGRECVFENITDTDRCFYFVHVNYTDEKGIRVLLNADEMGAFADVGMSGLYNCKGIKFYPFGYMPAGWLVTKVESNKTLSVKTNVEASENPDAVTCYSSAPLNIETGEVGSWSPGLSGFTRPGFNVVKYDPSACPTSYKMFGNKIPETSLEINITVFGVTDPKKNTVAITLAGGMEHYAKMRFYGLFIAPVATTWLHKADGSVDKTYGAPQLWAVINNAQWGSRKIVVKMISGSGSASASASGVNNGKARKLSYGVLQQNANWLFNAIPTFPTFSASSTSLNALKFADEERQPHEPREYPCTPFDECGPGSRKTCPAGQTCDVVLCACEGGEPTPTPGGGRGGGIPPEKTSVKELTFEFDGPGAQFFTYAPTPGSKLVFYEEVDGQLIEITGTKGLLAISSGMHVSPYNFWAEYKDYASDPTPEGFVETLGNDVYDAKKFELFAKQIGFKPGQVANLVHAKILGREIIKTDGKTYSNLRPVKWLRPGGEAKADFFQPLNVFAGFKQKSPLEGVTEDCSENENYKKQGIFLLHYSATGDQKVGQGELTAEVVHVTRDQQFGYACSKEASAWDDVELCAPAYADFSRFGACWNTLNAGFEDSAAFPGTTLAQAEFVGRFTGGALISGGGKKVVVSPAGFVIMAVGGNAGDQGKGACITTDKNGNALTAPDFAECWVKSAGIVFETWYPNGTIHSPEDAAKYKNSDPSLYAKVTSQFCPVCKENNELCDCEGNTVGKKCASSNAPAAKSTFGLCTNHYWTLSRDASSVFWKAGVNCVGKEPRFWSDVATLALGNCVKQEAMQALDCENENECLTSTRTYSGNKVLGARLEFKCVDPEIIATGISDSDVEPIACSFAAPNANGEYKVLWGTRNPGGAPAAYKCFKRTPGDCAPCFYSDLSSKACVQSADEVNTNNNAKFLMCYDTACGGAAGCIINPDCSQPE